MTRVANKNKEEDILESNKMNNKNNKKNNNNTNWANIKKWI